MKFQVDENIIMYSFRYCLGRMTYAVSEMVTVLINNWNKLRKHTQEKIQSEIKEAMYDKRAGMGMDVKEWQKILDLEVTNEMQT